MSLLFFLSQLRCGLNGKPGQYYLPNVHGMYIKPPVRMKHEEDHA